MLSRLEIINSMLAASGTSPVTGANVSHPMYVKAANKLDETIASVLKLNLWFNTRLATLIPNIENEIVLPSNTINADPQDAALNYVKRGNRMYNMDTGSYEITETTVVQITQKLDLEEIPESALDYIKAKARYEFFIDEEGEEARATRYEKLMLEAWTLMYREHLRSKDTNYFNGPNNFSRFLKRGSSPLTLHGSRD